MRLLFLMLLSFNVYALDVFAALGKNITTPLHGESEWRGHPAGKYGVGHDFISGRHILRLEYEHISDMRSSDRGLNNLWVEYKFVIK